MIDVIITAYHMHDLIDRAIASVLMQDMREGVTVTIVDDADEEPYDDVYIFWLDQRIALNNNDTKRLNIASQAFNNAYLAYQQWYNRTHRPLKPRPHLLRHEVLN